MANKFSKYSTKYHLAAYGFRTKDEADYFVSLLTPIMDTVIDDFKKTYMQKNKPTIDIVGSTEIIEKVDR